jgi:hypothetical protein
MSLEECEPSTPTPPIFATPPCEVDIPLGNLDTECVDWGISAGVALDPHLVRREPYPRGMVAIRNFLAALEPVYEEKVGAWSNYAFPAPRACDANNIGNTRNLRIRVRWKRLLDFGSVGFSDFKWRVEDRDWRVPGGVAEFYGGAIEYTYETSSYGLPLLGPGLSGQYELPAYRIEIESHWLAQWQYEYDECVCYRWEERWSGWQCREGTDLPDNWRICKGEPGHTGLDGPPDCDADGDGIIDDYHYKTYEGNVCADWGWEHRVVPGAGQWGTWDLREYGYPNYYLEWKRVRVEGETEVRDYIAVPIIEVQGVIKK